MRKYCSWTSSSLIGLFFLISAFAKAWGGEAFADLLLLYGPSWMGVLAPLTIAAEVLLGTALLLRIHLRTSAILTDVFLVIVTVVYAYGLGSGKVSECGCMGVLNSLFPNAPWFTFLRNGVLVALTVPLLLNKNEGPVRTWKGIVMTLLVAAATFICGLSMNRSFRLPHFPQSSSGKEISMDALLSIYPFDADSTYVVYLFSFDCPHCLNFFANLQQYQQLHLADRVLGIAMENEQAQARFDRLYQPQIDILTISQNSMAQLTRMLPVRLTIFGNQIEETEKGQVTSPALFVP